MAAIGFCASAPGDRVDEHQDVSAAQRVLVDGELRRR
jgi:hypothetical protein